MANASRIFLVDDDASIRRLCRRILERMGFDILEAENVQTARACFAGEAGTLRAAIVDLHLPDGSGESLADEICAHDPDLPILYFTGSAQADQTVTVNGRRRYYLKKPFTRESMQTVLENAGVSLPA